MAMVRDAGDRAAQRVKDGRTWHIGTDEDVAWIEGATTKGLTITSAIPPIFDAYATVVVPEDRAQSAEHVRAIVELLREQSPDQPWWLGYLDTGGEDTVFPDAPMVTLYAGWRYVLVEAGPDQAAAWRDSWQSWRGAVPDLIFPADRTWLLSRLWDDDWRCLGGPRALVDRFVDDVRLGVRRVGPDEDATPPGHTAF